MQHPPPPPQFSILPHDLSLCLFCSGSHFGGGTSVYMPGESCVVVATCESCGAGIIGFAAPATSLRFLDIGVRLQGFGGYVNPEARACQALWARIWLSPRRNALRSICCMPCSVDTLPETRRSWSLGTEAKGLAFWASLCYATWWSASLLRQFGRG